VPYGAKKFEELWQQLPDKAGVKRIANVCVIARLAYSLAANPATGLVLTAHYGEITRRCRIHTYNSYLIIP
jgi:hypothetical protein